MRLTICRWCGGAIEPNAARFRLFRSRSIRVVGLWVALLDAIAARAAVLDTGEHE